MLESSWFIFFHVRKKKYKRRIIEDYEDKLHKKKFISIYELTEDLFKEIQFNIKLFD